MVSSFRLSIAPKKIDERESEHNGTKDPTGDKHLHFAILLFRVWTISLPFSNSFVRCSFVPICSFGLCKNQWVFLHLRLSTLLFPTPFSRPIHAARGSLIILHLANHHNIPRLVGGFRTSFRLIGHCLVEGITLLLEVILCLGHLDDAEFNIHVQRSQQVNPHLLLGRKTIARALDYQRKGRTQRGKKKQKRVISNRP